MLAPHSQHCDCDGEGWQERIYHVREFRHRYFYCPACGREWTLTEQVADVDQPVTSDEIIEMVETLQREDLTLSDLLAMASQHVPF